MEVLTLLLVLFMIATAVVLFTGIAGFIRGGAFNEKYGNALMRARIGLQFVAVLLLGLILALRG